MRQVAAAGALSLALALQAGAQEVGADEYLRRVAAHHPAVRQAQLVVEQARGEAQAARGGFDPYLSASLERKRFGGTDYYDYSGAALTIPTPLGADVKLQWERADGRYANPERRTPDRGLLSAGISVPLGQRMVTDERRTALAVARSIRDASGAERDALVNRVLLQAARDYARWYEATRRLEVAREGVRLAEFRLEAVRRRVAAGEAAALDTVEARLEVGRRQALVLEGEQAAFSARELVEVHLWDERGEPVTLPAEARPSSEGASIPDASRRIADVAESHPEVTRATARLSQATLQWRLAAQQRLPLVTADLAALGDAGEEIPSIAGGPGDIKAGVSARSPLLYLRERGREAAAGARVDQLRLERDRIRREVAVAARIASGEVGAVARAAAVQREAVQLARRLVEGEQRRFDAGESTLFLVNTRERALLDEQLRLAALEARALAARAELTVALGAWPAGR